MKRQSSQSFSSKIFLIAVNLLLGINLNFICEVSANDVTDSFNECKWTYNKSVKHTTCNIRTLEAAHSVELLQDAQGTQKLDIICDESVMFESQIPNKFFRDISSLSELTLDSCKILKITQHTFDGLGELKKLTVNTKNSQWSSVKSLEMQQNAMSGLKQLTILELTDSNIRVIPDGFYCPLNNLQVLNLTRNRLRTTENLGFSGDECNALKEISALDLSWNELRIIPENWAVSKLRRLQHLNLQHNNISELSSETLTGLNALRTFNLSYNHIDQIPNGLFSSSKELREIHLQSNELYELPKGVFHKLTQLLVLDLSKNLLTSHHINNETFAGLIRLVILNLSHNSLTRIDSTTFKELYFLQELNLRNNSIGYIDDNTFAPLYNLHELNLAENRLHTLNDKLFNGLQVLSKLTLNNNLISIVEVNVFKNCSDLKELDLSSNQLQEVPEALQVLSVLRTLDLGENQITQFKAGAFKNLIQLNGLRLIDNQIENITKGMFEDLPRLSVLNIAKNRIQSIEQGSFDANKEIEAIRLDGNFVSDINGIFSGLSSLLWLNLAENHLSWFDYAFVPSNLKWLDIHGCYIESLQNYYKLQEGIRIKTLDASHNRLIEIGPLNVPNSIELLFINNNHIQKIHPNTFVDKVNLTRVDLYANSLQKLQMHQLRIAPSIAAKTRTGEKEKLDLQPLPEFYLGGNPFECDCSMEWLHRINNFTSRQHPKIMDLQNIECIMPHRRGASIRPIEHVDIIDFVCPYEAHCFALCHCCDQNGCECDMTCPKNCSCYHDQTWATNMVDCGHQASQNLPRFIPADTTELYLDGNNYPELDVAPFRQHSKLRHLFLNSSKVEIIRNRTFFGLSTLQTLHLHDNRLQKLYGYEFEQLLKLKELNLHNNQLTFIGNQTFAYLKSLQFLRIDGNRLVNTLLWQLLPSINSNSEAIQLERISMGRNPWSCRCRFIQEMTQFVAENALIIQDAQDIYCVDEENENIQRELDLNSTSACSDFYLSSSKTGIANFILFHDFIPLLFTLIVTICLLILFVVLFVFRAQLKLWFCSHYGFFGPPCEDTEKLYDAVIFHSAKDIEYVIKHIANEFESGRPPNLRMCLQYRDLNEDANYIQLLETACASRKIVILLTRNFLQTEWVRFDLRRAVHESLRGRPYKLVIIEDADVGSDAENDIELLPYLKASGVSRIKRNDRNFVDKLRYALPMEVVYRGTNNYTLEHQQHHMTLPNYPQHMVPQQHQQMKHQTNSGTLNGGMMYHNHHHRQAPPAYCPELDETNYSSATTATPSPHPSRHNILSSDIHHPSVSQSQPNQSNHQRPLSEHIYSSIDSDYSTLDCENQLLQPQMQTVQHLNQSSIDSSTGLNRPNAAWHNNGNIPNGQHVQAYLV
ncbi:CLUMA_CG000605, isoform A [Clunio marinus]|uniref:CLUMA_CG000605, isoform A n=1 Tax=Clunio marinus TaxID=568069 RepID=A0A1J1HFI0_9DIPT|nr:CLUMA_CG000605, isoform A [Clunio marinus]